MDSIPYRQQLDEKIQRLERLFDGLPTPGLAVFPSPPEHYRMRAEFRIWHEGDDIHYAMFDPGQKAWDFPKGKKEKGENIAVCALREVVEETGVKKLMLIRFRTITYHIFKQDGEYLLKETYWYDMHTNYKGKLKAQVEEDIEKVCWKTESEVKELIKKSYKNIQKIFEL